MFIEQVQFYQSSLIFSVSNSIKSLLRYADFADRGYSIPASPLELTREVDIVFTGLPMPHHVKQVFEGGLLEGLTDGKIWIDHSTTG